MLDQSQFDWPGSKFNCAPHPTINPISKYINVVKFFWGFVPCFSITIFIVDLFADIQMWLIFCVNTDNRLFTSEDRLSGSQQLFDWNVLINFFESNIDSIDFQRNSIHLRFEIQCLWSCFLSKFNGYCYSIRVEFRHNMCTKFSLNSSKA